MPALLDGYLTREQLAQELGVHHLTIIRYQQQPDGLPFTKFGRRVLYNRASVQRWIEKHERHPNPTRRSR
ncbi:DNA-binding protein [Mesorhizobium denitrificans]|uniref:DNA-binding protein n=1 Tax=Mesorhizobium denitrificans TaxID=2294114 RepID=A0A371XFZ4_9HYPH|nr:DNA-binding protein [Mesorhizobium denitrificans]